MRDAVLVEVLGDDGAVAQLVEFSGVADGEFTAGIAAGIVELRRPVDARRQLADVIDFAFPSDTELADYLVLAGQSAAGTEVVCLIAHRSCSPLPLAVLLKPLKLLGQHA